MFHVNPYFFAIIILLINVKCVLLFSSTVQLFSSLVEQKKVGRVRSWTVPKMRTINYVHNFVQNKLNIILGTFWFI